MKHKIFNAEHIRNRIALVKSINARLYSRIDLNITKQNYKFEEFYKEYVATQDKNNAHVNTLKAIAEWNDKNPDAKLFPKLTTLDPSLLTTNSVEQREIDWDWVAKIVKKFDPKQVATLYVAYSPKDDTYYVYEGQHTAMALMIMYQEGKLPKDWKVNVQVIETDDPMVRRFLTEAINGGGKKPWIDYDYFQNGVYAANYSGSTEIPHLQYLKKFKMLLDNGMYILDNEMHKGIIKKLKSKQGLITHIDLVRTMEFSVLEKAVKWHNKFFKDEALHSVTLHMFNEWSKLMNDYNFTMSDDMLDDIGAMMVNTFGTIEEYSNTITPILKKWNASCGEPKRNANRRDKVTIPLVMYKGYGGNGFVPGMLVNQYNGSNGGPSLTESMGIKNTQPSLVVTV